MNEHPVQQQKEVHQEAHGQASPVPPAPVKAHSRVRFPGSVSGSKNYGSGRPVTGGEVITVPVISKHYISYVEVPYEMPVYQPRIITIEPSRQTVNFLFKSQSSPITVRQQHTPAPGVVHEPTMTQDEPIVLRHQVVKPIVQELRETIQPYRKVTQEIRPVMEDVRVIVHTARKQHNLHGPIKHIEQQLEQQPLYGHHYPPHPAQQPVSGYQPVQPMQDRPVQQQQGNAAAAAAVNQPIQQQPIQQQPLYPNQAQPHPQHPLSPVQHHMQQQALQQQHQQPQQQVHEEEPFEQQQLLDQNYNKHSAAVYSHLPQEDDF